MAARFHEILVDEAQDTSELQLACLDALYVTGRLDSLVLIGDIEQSICSYTGASPADCESFAERHGLERIELVENHRSSQRICDAAAHFCARPADRAVGADAACPWAPELIVYPAAAVDDAAFAFRSRVDALGASPDDAAILARSNDLVNEINGYDSEVECKPRPTALGRAAAARLRGTLTRRRIEGVERVVAHAAWGRADVASLESDARRRLRDASMVLLTSLPTLDLDLRSWIRGASAQLGAVLGALTDEPAHKPGAVVRSSSGQEAVTAADVFARPTSGLRAQTVHDIKGESRDAVLVVVDRLRSRRRAAQSVLWSRPLIGETVSAEEAEELRIAFVALTRARRYCALAVPDDTDPETIAAFEAAGFVRIG